MTCTSFPSAATVADLLIVAAAVPVFRAGSVALAGLARIRDLRYDMNSILIRDESFNVCTVYVIKNFFKIHLESHHRRICPRRLSPSRRRPR